MANKKNKQQRKNKPPKKKTAKKGTKKAGGSGVHTHINVNVGSGGGGGGTGIVPVPYSSGESSYLPVMLQKFDDTLTKLGSRDISTTSSQPAEVGLSSGFKDTLHDKAVRHTTFQTPIGGSMSVDDIGISGFVPNKYGGGSAGLPHSYSSIGAGGGGASASASAGGGRNINFGGGGASVTSPRSLGAEAVGGGASTRTQQIDPKYKFYDPYDKKNKYVPPTKRGQYDGASYLAKLNEQRRNRGVKM